MIKYRYADCFQKGYRYIAMSINIETVNTGNFSMDFFRFGHGDRTFVILPGVSVQSVMDFADLVADEYEVFSDEYTTYVFDRRKELPGTYSIHEMALDTAEAIRALNLEHIDLFGASQGGMIAMEIAIDQPDLIRKLALGSTSSHVEEPEYKEISKWIEAAKAGDTEGLYLAFGEAVYPENVFEQSKEMLKDAAKAVTDDDLKRFIILAEGIEDFDITEKLSTITCPVLVIGSADDNVLGSDASRRIAENLSEQAEPALYMYDGYGHAAYDTAPDYRDRLLRFFLD